MIDLAEDPAQLGAARQERQAPGGGAPGPRSQAVTTYLEVVEIGADAQARLENGLVLLAGLVPGCHHASATTPLPRGLEVQAATDETSRRADDLQHELRQGPSLHALRHGHSVIAHDLGDEPRWPRWSARSAAELGLGAVLSVLLLSRRRPLGTLNLYSVSPLGLSDVDVALVHRLAAPLSSALMDARATHLPRRLQA